MDVTTPRQRLALSLCALGLALGSAVVAAPLWVALVLGAWFANLSRPLLLRLSKALGGRHRAAAILTVLLLVLLLTPLLLGAASLLSEALRFGRRIMASPDGKDALKAIVSEGGEGLSLSSLHLQDVLPLLQEHGSRALGVLTAVAGATARGLIGLFIFLLTGYGLLVDGPRAYAWLEARQPLRPAHFRRLGDAFQETGRGLIIGVGLTALAQGTLATVAYLALRIPSALTLGLLTAIAALVPSFGTALVWVPVAAGLALTGRWISALILAGVGVFVIGTIDNLLRPALARYGRLQLPTLALFVAIFGGLALLGAWGFVLGPLLFRLAREALDLWAAEERGAPPGPLVDG